MKIISWNVNYVRARVENNLVKLQQPYDCCTKDILLKRLIISCDNKGILLEIIDLYKNEISSS